MMRRSGLGFILGFFLLLGFLEPLSAQSGFVNVRIHYHRPDGVYDGWGLHLWGAELGLPRMVSWTQPLYPNGRDDFGVYWDVPVKSSAASVSFIVHNGELKNSPENLSLKFLSMGREVWILMGDGNLYTKKNNYTPTATPPPKDEKTSADPVKPAGEKPSTASRPVVTPPAVLNPNNAAPKNGPAQAPSVQDKTNEASVSPAKSSGSANPQPLPSSGGAFSWFHPLVLGLLGGFVLFFFLTIILLWRNRGLKKTLEIQKAQLAQETQALVQETEARLIQKSSSDELTGLPNRAALNQALAQAVTKARRYRKQLAVISIDLDHFKPINDTLGHEAGDFVLKTIAERFRECLRSSDLIARLGGDEFVVVIEEPIEPKFVAGVAQKLLAAASRGFVIEGQEIHVSVSMGIATFPHDGKDPGVLLKNADGAMYKAKEKGKDNFQYYSDDHNTHNLQRAALEASLRHAVEKKEMVLHYQPIVNLANGHPVYVEALVRWSHPDMGLVAPGQFIPLAEENGMIGEIGHWVLESALRQGKKWLLAGYPVKICVNLSPLQLGIPGFVTQVAKVLELSAFPPQALVFELTENLLMANQEEYVVVMEDLKALGIKIALDDFGTGYSSLSVLKKFPIDIVKIDRSFLRGIPEDEENGALVGAIASLAQKLGRLVVAEGVETPAQKEFLDSLDCPLAQGHFFCKAVAAEELTSFLAHLKK